MHNQWFARSHYFSVFFFFNTSFGENRNLVKFFLAPLINGLVCRAIRDFTLIFLLYEPSSLDLLDFHVLTNFFWFQDTKNARFITISNWTIVHQREKLCYPKCHEVTDFFSVLLAKIPIVRDSLKLRNELLKLCFSLPRVTTRASMVSVSKKLYFCIFMD